MFNLGTFFTTGVGVVVFFMILMKDLAGTVLFSIFFGLFSGACVSTTTAMLGASKFVDPDKYAALAHFENTVANTAKHPNEVGTRMGMFFGVGGFFGLFGTSSLSRPHTCHKLTFDFRIAASPISGALLTGHYLWTRTIVFTAVSNPSLLPQRTYCSSFKRLLWLFAEYASLFPGVTWRRRRAPIGCSLMRALRPAFIYLLRFYTT